MPQNAIPQQPTFFVELQPGQQQFSICEHAFALSLNVAKLGFADSEARMSEVYLFNDHDACLSRSV